MANELSIVVPLFNEEENVEPLVEAVREALAGVVEYELLLVDDGSTDRTAGIAARVAEEDARVRLIRLSRNYGQATAMQAGLDCARSQVVVTMDGDLQNDPEDIPRLLAKLDEGFDLVVGYRERRKDKLLSRRLPSWVANRLIQILTHVQIRDNGCSLKAYRRELVERMHLYSDMHRFIPAVAVASAGARISEIPVRHHPRRYGRSKYGVSRVGKVLIDLLTITMIRSFGERPLALFGTGAAGAAVLGVLFSVAALVSMVSFRAEKAHAFVLPGAGLMWFGLSFYLFMLGLIAEAALREERGEDAGHIPVVREAL